MTKMKPFDIGDRVRHRASGRSGAVLGYEVAAAISGARIRWVVRWEDESGGCQSYEVDAYFVAGDLEPAIDQPHSAASQASETEGVVPDGRKV